MIGNVTSQIKIIISLISVIGIGAAVWYVQSLQHNVEMLTNTVATQEKLLKEYKTTQQFLEEILKDNELRTEKLANQLKANQDAVDGLRKDLSDNDVDNILQKKSKLFEKIIRNGTAEYYKNVEETTQWSEK